MKRFSLDLFCVFIILMFCLSPLSAMELSLDDNNKYTNDVNEGHVALKDVSKEGSRLSISVSQTENPGEVLVKLSAIPRFKGTVHVEISGSSAHHQFYMHDGKGEFLVEGLEPGVHTAKAIFYGDEDFSARNATTTFEVI